MSQVFQDLTALLLHTVVIRVTDSGGLTSNGSITIRVAKINNAPRITGLAVNIVENSAVGTLLCIVVGTDRDVGTTLTYSIVSGDPFGVFAINSTSGSIRVVKAGLDYEGTPAYDLVVAVSDDDLLNPLTATAVVAVRLVNVNEVR